MKFTTIKKPILLNLKEEAMKFIFKDRVTEESVLLDDIDKAVCEYWGEEYSKSDYNHRYMSLTTVGIVCAQPKSVVTEEQFEAWAARTKAGWLGAEMCFFKEFLCKRYIFEAWH
jgi:hypothetical protein